MTQTTNLGKRPMTKLARNYRKLYKMLWIYTENSWHKFISIGIKRNDSDNELDNFLAKKTPNEPRKI